MPGISTSLVPGKGILRNTDCRTRLFATPVSAESFNETEFREQILQCRPTEQASMLQRTTPLSLGTDAEGFLNVLITAESLINEEPALSTCWRMRHELEQELRQERPG